MSGGAGDSPPPPAPPPSPEFPPVLLSACMDSIIHLALTDSSPDLTLSAAYRSALLQPDPLTTYQSLPPSHFPSGIPPHPLYKPLARSIHACMASGDFPGRPELTVGLPSWIAGTGIELSNMLEAVEFQLHVQDPFFSQLTVVPRSTHVSPPLRLVRSGDDNCSAPPAGSRSPTSPLPPPSLPPPPPHRRIHPPRLLLLLTAASSSSSPLLPPPHRRLHPFRPPPPPHRRLMAEGADLESIGAPGLL